MPAASRQAIVMQKSDGSPAQLSQPTIPAQMSVHELEQVARMSHSTLSGGQHPSIPTMAPTMLPEQLQLPPAPGQESRLREYIQENGKFGCLFSISIAH